MAIEMQAMDGLNTRKRVLQRPTSVPEIARDTDTNTPLAKDEVCSLEPCTVDPLELHDIPYKAALCQP